MPTIHSVGGIKKVSSAGTIYAYDGDNLVEETSSSGAVVARYADTQNIDEPLAMLRSSATSYYHADGLGSITSLSNASGVLSQTYVYDSYGKEIASSGNVTNPFQDIGREFDTETGLYFYRARYFDPATGRFLTEDPLGFGANDLDFYRYAYDSPANFTDPFGTNNLPVTLPYPITRPIPIPIPWPKVVGGIIGALLGELVGADSTNPDAALHKDPIPGCPKDKNRDDPCYIQYLEDTAWCGETFTDDKLYELCMEIAWFNYEACKDGREPAKRDPRDYPKPTNSPVNTPNPKNSSPRKSP